MKSNNLLKKRRVTLRKVSEKREGRRDRKQARGIERLPERERERKMERGDGKRLRQVWRKQKKRYPVEEK